MNVYGILISQLGYFIEFLLSRLFILNDSTIPDVLNDRDGFKITKDFSLAKGLKIRRISLDGDSFR